MPYTTLKTLHKSFQTDPEHWLGHSGYFEALFSGNWADKQEDNSYLIEADSDIFEHVLRFLRTGVLPIFYDNTKGHDLALYHALLGEAEYFAIDRLCKWIREKKYLEAVQVCHQIAWYSKDASIESKSQEEVSVLRVTLQQNHYFCRASQRYHKFAVGGSDTCACADIPMVQDYQPIPSDRSNQAPRGGWRNEDTMNWSVVRKRVVVDHNLCVTAFLDEDAT